MEVLTEKQIQKIVDVIGKGYQPEKVILFGSYAKRRQNKWSDLDFMVIKKTKQRYLKRPLTVMDLFDPYPHAMDFFVYAPEEFENSKTIMGSLTKVANEEGRLTYGN